jgi:hypothetical protein
MFSGISWRKLEYFLASSIAIVTFIIYISTLCPTVSFIDSGELSAVAYTLGIAHPTGYPLFSLIGWVFVHLPLGLRPIYQLNLMAAILCSLGLFMFFRFLVFFLSEFAVKNQKGFAAKEAVVTPTTMMHIFIPALVGTLVLGFSETYWSQALSTEVYSLHVFFLASILFLFTKAITIESANLTSSTTPYRRNYNLYGFAFTLGLSFTNHMTTILLAPAFLYLFFYVKGFSKKTWRDILRLVIPFLLGFSVYLYLPFRASGHPMMNWGNPVDIERFLWHFGAKQYRVWIFTSSESAAKQMKYFLDTLLPEFAYFPVVIAAIGLWRLLREKRVTLIFTVLLFLCCLLYSINYDIHDIDSYFLLAYFTIAIWTSVGVQYIIGIMKSQTTARVAASLLALSCVILVIHNYPRVDQSKTFVVEDYTKDMLQSVEPNGIIISYQWDYFVSASYYMQLVEKVRQDVVVIDKELLRRSWYFKQLENRYPWLIAQSRNEVNAFLNELYKFERDLPYNSNIIEYRYSAMIKSLIGKNYSSRPVYVTREIEPQYTGEYERVPAGLAFRLYNKGLSYSIVKPEFHFRLPSKSDKYIEGILGLYAQAYYNTALYLTINGKNDAAITYLDKALQVQSNFREAMLLKEKIVSGEKF